LKLLWFVIFWFITIEAINAFGRTSAIEVFRMTNDKNMVFVSYVIVAILGAALSVTYWWTIGKGLIALASKKAEPTEQQATPKKPDAQQSSQGNNSPNTTIIGNNNVVTNSIASSDPKVLAKLDEIRKLIREQQGDRATPGNLLKKYPLGYVVFDIDEQKSVFPYASKSLLDHWDFDWSTVKLTENEQKNHVWLTMPNMVDKVSRTTIRSMQTEGPKKLGIFGARNALLATDNFYMRAEILAIKQDGIVFLIGFTRPD
jgi:hypothetical protein